MVIILYCIILSFKGVRLLQKTKLIRSIIFFLVIPILVYSVILGSYYYRSSTNYSDMTAYNDRALEYMEAGYYDKAERLFLSALSGLTKDDREDMATIYENLGLLFSYKGDNTSAVEHYQKALTFYEPDEAAYYTTLAKIYYVEGDCQNSINNCKRALIIDNQNFAAHNKLGLIFTGECHEDLIDYDQALIHNLIVYKLNPSNATSRNLAINYFKLGRYSDALPLFEWLDRNRPDDSDTKLYLGLIYYENNDFTRAKIYWGDAIKLDPEVRPVINSFINTQDYQSKNK
jgi:tetratricopeptide (TPR) repeat protein